MMIRLLLLTIVFITTACKKAGLDSNNQASALQITSQEVVDYSSTLADVRFKATVPSTMASEIIPLSVLRFYQGNLCGGSELGFSVAQDIATQGVLLKLPLAPTTLISFKSDTKATCYTFTEFQLAIDPVPAPQFVEAIPASPSRVSFQPAIKGTAFPDSGNIAFFSDIACTQSIGGGTVTFFEQTGLNVTLPADSTTPIYAKTIDPRGTASACTLLTNYTHTTALAQDIEFSSITPLSPASTTTSPLVKGLTDTDVAEVTLYTEAACAVPIVTGTKADFEGAGLAVTVASNAATTIYARGRTLDNIPTACLFMTSFTHDSIVPAPPSFLSANPISPTRVTTLPRIIGTAPADASLVRLFSSATCVQSIGFGLKSEFEAAGITANLVPNTTNSIYARTIDAAGNISACVYLTDYRHNTIPPDPPIFNTSIPASPTNVTSSPLMLGTAAPNTTELRFYTNDTCTVQVGSGSATDLETVGITVNLLPNTVSQIYVTAHDLEGNIGACSGFTSFAHSTNPAPVPVFSVSYPVSPSRVSTTPSLLGTAPSSVTHVTLFSDVACTTQLATGTRGALATVGIYVTLPANMTSDVYARSLDIYGNSSPCVLFTSYTHTNLAPMDPAFTSVTPLSPNNVSYTPTLFGSSMANMASPLAPIRVSFYDSSACVIKLGEGTPAQFSSTGISITVAADTPNTIYARAFDAAGNMSQCTFLTNYVHNTLKPGRPLLGTLTPGTPSYTAQTIVKGTFASSPDFMNRVSVSYYSDVNCTQQITTSSPNDFTGAGVSVVLTQNQVSALSAASFNEVGNRSDCSLLSNFNAYDTPPASLTVSANLDGSMQIFWLPDTVASPQPLYILKRALTSTGPFTVVYSGLDTSFRDNNIRQGDTYYYIVQSSNSTGLSRESAPVSRTVSAPAALAPVMLTATPTSAQVRLTWSGWSQNMAYYIYRSLQPGGPYTQLPVQPTSANYTDTGLVNGTMYYYIVKGFNPSGKSFTSNEVRVTPLASPAPITSLTIEPVLSSPACGGSSGVILRWVPPTHYTSFRLSRNVGGFGVTNGAGSSIMVPWFVDCTPVTTGGFPDYYSIAVNWGTISIPSSNYIQFNEGSSTLSAHGGNNEVLLSWSVPAFTTVVDIYKASQSHGPYSLLTTTANTGSYTDTTVVNGTAAFYYIQARSAVDVYRGFPSPKVGTTPNPAPGAPTNLVFRAGTAESAELFWTAPSSYNRFFIYRADNIGGPYSYLAESSSNYFTDGSPAEGLNYYQVRTAWGNSVSAPSNTVSFRKAYITGLASVNTANDVQLSWDVIGGASEYRIEKAPQVYGPWTTLGFPVAAAFTDTTAVVGEAYYYRISARFPDSTEGLASSPVDGRRLGSNKPAGLSALEITPNTVNLQWVKVLGATNYQLKRATNLGGPYTVVFTSANGNISNYVYGSLAVNQRYYLRVAANVGGTYYDSDPLSTETIGVPTAPFAQIGNNQMEVFWDLDLYATSFTLERSTDGVNFVPIASGLTLSMYTDTGVVNGSIYFYRIKNVYTLGETTSLSSIGYTPGRVPANPEGLAVSRNDDGVSLELSWARQIGASRYNVYLSTSNLGPFASVVSTSSTSNVAVTGLNPGTTYYLYVTSLDGAMESSPSTMISVIPSAPPNAPLITYQSPTSVLVTWDPVPGAVSYNVLRSTTGERYDVLATGLVGLSYTDTTVATDKIYNYQIIPISGGGEILAPSLISNPMYTAPVPLKPEAFTVESLDMVIVNLKWAAVPNASSYEIYRSTVSGSGFTLLSTISATSTQFNDASVVANTTYYYKVRALSPTGVPSLDSDEKNIRLELNPTGLTGVNNNKWIDLSWTAVPGASGYLIWRSLSTGRDYGYIGTSATNSFSDGTAEPDKTHYYIVTAQFANGTSSGYSNEFSILKTGSLNFTHAIELLDRGIASIAGMPTIFDRSKTSFNTLDYNGTVTYRFEIVAVNTDSSPREVYLVDGSGIKATMSVPAFTSDPLRLETSFTATNGAQVWRLQMEGTTNNEDLKVTQARVLVRQENASRSRIYIPLLSSSLAPTSNDYTGSVVSTTATTLFAPSSQIPFVRELTKYSKLPAFNAWTLEAVVGRTGLAQGDLAFKNTTTDQLVSRTTSEFASDQPTLLNSDIQEGETQFASANDGHQYNLVFRCRTQCGTGQVHLFKAGLWLRIEQATKLQLHQRTSLGEVLNSGLSNIWNQRLMYLGNEMTSASSRQVFYYTAMSAGSTVSLVSHGLFDSGSVGTSLVTNAQVTTAINAQPVLFTSPVLSLTNTHRYFVEVNATGSLTVHGSKLLIDVTQ